MTKLSYRPRTKPFDHQRRALIRAARQQNLALHMEPRTGKTKVAIDYCGIQAVRGCACRVLVLAPLGVIGVWEYELHLHAPYSYICKVLGERPYKVTRAGAPTLVFLIVNHDKFNTRQRAADDSWEYPYIEAIERWKPDVVIVDESHRFKRAGGVRSQALWRMIRRLRKHSASRQPFVLNLTGTPNPKGWQDLFAQFRIMDDSILGTNKAEFEADYVTYGYGRLRYTVLGYRNLSRLKRIIDEHSFTAHRAQCLDMPTELYQQVPVQLPEKARKIYNQMANDLIAEVRDGLVLDAKNTGARRVRLLQICGGFTTDGTSLHVAKLQVLKDLLTDLIVTDSRVILYCRFLSELKAVRQLTHKAGFDTVAISGGTDRKARDKARAEFQSQSSRPMALAFQVETGSLGIDLSAAHEVIFYSLPDGWDTWYQATSRVLGPGQRSPDVRYRYLITRGTVEGSQLSSLERKSDMHQELMKNPHRFLFGGS